MDFIAELSSLSPLEQMEKLKLISQDCRATQEAVLLDILSRNKNTEIGKKYGFSEIRSIKDFQEKITVSDWNDVWSYAQRMETGARDLLFDGIPEIFVLSSGTSGKPKHLPESKMGMQAKSLVSKLRMNVLASQIDLSKNDGFVFPFSNSAKFGITESNIPIGSASGLTLASADDKLKERLAYPSEILNHTDQDVVDYLLARFALEKNVKALIGNNPTRMVTFFETVIKHQLDLINDIEHGLLSSCYELNPELKDILSKLVQPNPKRASELTALIEQNEELLPKDYWPELELVSFWLSGSVGAHAHKLNKWLCKDTKYFDCGYGASEGKFNIPLKPFEPAGLLATPAYFFEFRPLDSDRFLLADELQDQTSYQLILTSYSGLYRYDMHDVVRVDGFIGNTPKIYFESKNKDFLNINGEKVLGSNVVDIVNRLLEKKSLSAKHIAIAAEIEKSCYQICIELDPQVDNGLDIQWLNELEETIKAEEITYKVFRDQNILKSPEIHLMQDKWLEALIEFHTPKNGGKNQIKLPVVYPQIPLREMTKSVIKNSDGLN